MDRNHLGIVGSGFMGQGIARAALSAGLTVTLHDSDADRTRHAAEALRTKLGGEAPALEERLRTAESLEELAAASSIIEAIVEDPSAKIALFERLGSLDRQPRLLATNTSSIPITLIASRTPRPDRVIGMHFFAPAHATLLCEIVRGLDTSDGAAEQAQRLAETLGKQHITLTRDDAGFVTSRLMSVLVQEAARIVESGIASAEEVDRACILAFGHRMGPLSTTDLTGVDVAVNAATRILEATGREAFRPPELMQRMVAAGRLGRKTGKGFFDYA